MPLLAIPWIIKIVQAFEAAIAAAPQVVELVNKAKEFIAAMFGAKLITKAQQDALHARIDAHVLQVQAGIIDPALLVEPDPA